MAALLSPRDREEEMGGNILSVCQKEKYNSDAERGRKVWWFSTYILTSAG